MGEKHLESPPQEPIISRIEVVNLFGTYSYDLRALKSNGPESGRIMLLYGNNGSGKTTILNLLYHLLHPEPSGGHRTLVGRVPFGSFCVHLVGGQRVFASRPEGRGTGDYNVTVSDSTGAQLVSYDWIEEKTGRDESKSQNDKFCAFLSSLGTTFHYLKDSRRVEGQEYDPSPAQIRRHIQRGEFSPSAFEFRLEAPDLSYSEKELQRAINSAIEWFHQQALSGSNIGYTSINSIYSDIVKRIVTTGPSIEETDPKRIEIFKIQINELRERNERFTKFRLTPDFETGELVESLEKATPQTAGILNAVLGPFLESYQARLKALEGIQRVMNSFESLLEDFYTEKTVSVRLGEELGIRTSNGQPLSPSQLSSGEKQLLLLFCNAISSRRERTVLMIDEPELSLNVKWQRRLIPALLTCMEGTSFQFIFATHSMELISQYEEYVTPLENLQVEKE